MPSSSSVEIDADVLANLATKSDLAPLVTREELAAAIARLATREEMHAAIAAAVAPLATRAEMHAAIAAAVAPLATREELQDLRSDLKSEIREEGERTTERVKRYFDIVAERLESSVKVIAEGHVHLDTKIDGVRNGLKGDITALDRRVTRLETRRRPR